jgi:hypothetical protein
LSHGLDFRLGVMSCLYLEITWASLAPNTHGRR